MHGKLVLAALAATMLLAIGVGGATARNLSINEKNFEYIWNEVLGSPKTKLEFIASGTGINIQCRLTLLGRFTERTIKKEPAINQGTINHGELESCTGGTVTMRTETMPWTSRYGFFEGILPRIRSLVTTLIGARFRVRESGGLECEITTELRHTGTPIIGNAAIPGEPLEAGLERTGEPEDVTSNRPSRIPLGGGVLCAIAEAELGGTGLIRNLPRTAKVRITLI
ncbi:MAG TPA: hypothetical protein VN635_12705 [Conexibacter sp.]|nr:hypothetical protein [Conexibacter sp.]